MINKRTFLLRNPYLKNRKTPVALTPLQRLQTTILELAGNIIRLRRASTTSRADIMIPLSADSSTRTAIVVQAYMEELKNTQVVHL